MMRRRHPLVLASAVAVASFSLLAIGCGGGGGSPVAGVATSTATALNGALAFACCMRSHGIPGWPDPDRGGHFDKSKLRQLGVSVSRVRALEEGTCNHLLNAGGS
jgi:hypothetical protein